MGYKTAVQVLKQADDLKPKVLKKCDLLNDSDVWTNQQKLQSVYHQVLILDLEYALDKKVEQDLWNIGFKNHISDLQERARDKKNPRRSDFQALLTWALESASGFYLTLLQELCNAFDIDLPFRRRGIVYGQIVSLNEQINVPQLASCSYICQYCLVHLGDIARYRNQRRQAESFYKQAILVSPISGHPYNQLALLEASQGDKLSTVFYYIRGISVKNPFPASTTNLMSILTAAIDKDALSEKIQTKMTVNEYIQLFLCTHGYFHTVTDINQAQLAVKSLNSVMTALVATQSFKKYELIKITVINLYALNHLGKDDELTPDEMQVKELILELIAGSLSAFLMPVYTLKTDESLLEYYALPAVKFLMYFIHNRPEVLKCKVFKERMQIWPSLCKLVNSAQSLLKGFNYNKFSKCSVQEDRDLQGFLPLNLNLKNLDCRQEIDDVKLENMVRMRRIIDFAIWLSEYEIDGTKLITKTENKGVSNFEPSLSQPDPTNELLEEMKSFTILEIKENKNKTVLEKKAGILKPQGSLEKAREEREVKKSSSEANALENSQKNSELNRSKRSKQNVALQSIIKKMEESKQVKFNVEDVVDKEKSVKFEQPTPPKIAQQPPLLPPPQQTQFTNPPPPLRTQSFNQNHPAFPLQGPSQNIPSQQIPQSQAPTDYLTSLRNLGKGADNSMMPQFSKNNPFSNLPANGNSSSNQQTQSIVKMPSFPSAFNVPPPQFNAWGREDIKFSSANNQSPWWAQTVPSQPQGFYPSPNQNNFHQQRQDNKLPSGQNYSNSNQHFPNPSHNFPSQRPTDNPAFGGMTFTPFNPQYQNQVIKTPSNNIPNLGSNNQGLQFDFLTPPWTGVNRINNFGGDDMGQSSMSMRQAMLKEATLPGSRMGSLSQQNISQTTDSQQIPGYSLFNNNWAPNLPGQFLNNKMAENNSFNVPQHSLFGGHGPQSLAQLLEHQQNQMSGNRNNPNQES